jgi:hypothetical protein
MSKEPLFIRLVCEGKVTEPNYFNQLLRAKGLKIPNAAYKPKDHSPLGIAKEARQIYKEALKMKVPKERIFVAAIFDRDAHVNLANAIESLRGTPIKVGFSNPCFEYWILLHFERTSRNFHNCDEVVQYIRRNHYDNYNKEQKSDHFRILHNKIALAIQNAESLWNNQWQHEERPIWERNPYTNIHQILQAIDGLLH